MCVAKDVTSSYLLYIGVTYKLAVNSDFQCVAVTQGDKSHYVENLFDSQG